MQGKIIKGIAGFYYVYVEGHGIYECKAKGIFRKDHVKPLVGDDVIVDVLDESKMLGNPRDFTEKKCFDPTGSGQCRSGSCDFCHCKTQSEF